MSSPEPARVKRSTPAPRRAAAASDAGMSGQDKANFIKAMMDGVKPKAAAGAKTKPAAVKPKKVVLLRKIPAPVRVTRPSNPASDEALALAAALEAKLAAGDLGALTPQAVQALMRALCRFYSANVGAGDKYPVVEGRMSVTGTDAMIVCGALLKAVDLQVFELGMWQSWSAV